MFQQIRLKTEDILFYKVTTIYVWDKAGLFHFSIAARDRQDRF